MKRIVISGGGTGGHVFPALSIACELRKRHPEAAILFVGARDKIEMKKVPDAGFLIRGLWISGWQRGKLVANLLFPLKLVLSLMRCLGILLSFRPQLAIGTGGFASGPLLQAASWLGIPYFLQEQNSYPGITNKLLARRAKKIFVAYEGLERFFPADRIVLTGNPIRSELVDIQTDPAKARENLGLDPAKTTLLVLGGSLGAARINELLESQWQGLTAMGLQILWQCGPGYIGQYDKYNGPDVRVTAFIDRMADAFAAADIIVSRSGAGTVSELMLQGKATVFIPSPNVAEDHQTQNALALSSQGAAVLVTEEELERRFGPELKKLVENTAHRTELGRKMRELAKPNATSEIVDHIEKSA